MMVSSFWQPVAPPSAIAPIEKSEAAAAVGFKNSGL